MGSCNPKPQPKKPPKKETLQFCCKKIKIHLQIKQNKINQEIISGQSQLVHLINRDKNQRNKFDQLLLAERVVNGLKYTADFLVYTRLIQYAESLKIGANFICENVNNHSKLQPWIGKIYSMLYASEKIPVSSLQEYHKCMQYFHNDILMQQHTDKKVIQYLTPQPSPAEMNMNKLKLVKVNEAGHNFTEHFVEQNNWDPQFKEKSQQFRNSLPRKQIFGDKDKKNHKKGGQGDRKSVSNPFDENKLVQEKELTRHQFYGQKDETDQKVDDKDVSPNITEMMKKIQSSRNTFKFD